MVKLNYDNHKIHNHVEEEMFSPHHIPTRESKSPQIIYKDQAPFSWVGKFFID